MYGGLSKDADIEGGGGIPQFEPGIYDDCTLESAEFTNAKKKDGSEGKKILEFTFKNAEGEYHKHAEWEVGRDDNDAEKKMANSFKRICHIARCFLDESLMENMKTHEYKSFDEMAETFAKKLSDKAGSKSPKVRVKVTGQVYNNQRRAGFPNYLGFISKSGDTKIQLSTNEKKEIKEYENFQPSGGTSGDYNDNFPTSGSEGPNDGGGDTPSGGDSGDDLPF